MRIVLSRTKITSLRMKKQTHSRKKFQNGFPFFMLDEIAQMLLLSKVPKQCALIFSIRRPRSVIRNCIFFLTLFFKNHIPSVTATLVLQIRCKSKKGRIDNHGHKESSQESTRQEGSQESYKEKVILRQEDFCSATGGRDKRPLNCFWE
jgi:hypothetical protein